MRTAAKPPEQPPPPPVYWTEDEVIRAAGFVIKARPATGPVLWTKGGKTYPHTFALEIATRTHVLAKVPETPPDEPSAIEAIAVDDNMKF